MAKAGFCSECGENVFLTDVGGCSKGHPASSVSGVYEPPVSTSATAPPVPARKASSKLLIVAVGVAGLLALCGVCTVAGLLGGSGGPASTKPSTGAVARPSPAAKQAPIPPAPTPPTEKSGGTESKARTYAAGVKAVLDVTTSDQLLAQMPDSIQPEMSREGDNRRFVWTFSDGSRLIAVFRPLGGEGSQQGLVLYMVDIED